MFRLDEFHKELADAEQPVGGQRHEDDDDGRYIASDHLLSVDRSPTQLQLISPAPPSAAAATQSSTNHCQSQLITFLVTRSPGEMYIGHGGLCVCLSLAAFPHTAQTQT